jgi:toxin ParE1/3/4
VKLRYTVPALAKRVQRRIQAVIELLLLYPFLGVRTGDPVIRRMTAMPYPYAVFYEVTGDEIIIHAVRHAARDPSSMPGSI